MFSCLSLLVRFGQRNTAALGFQLLCNATQQHFIFTYYATQQDSTLFSRSILVRFVPCNSRQHFVCTYHHCFLLAELSASSPRKLFIFIILKIYFLNQSIQKIFYFILKKDALPIMQRNTSALCFHIVCYVTQ